MEFNKYVYNGPVTQYDRCITGYWRGETVAQTEKKARSNLTYQVKKQMNLLAGTKVTLPGNIKIII